MFRKGSAVDFADGLLPFTPFVAATQSAIGGTSARCH
ncbi:Unknown protein sequence [Pseudomonas syringae pv. coryli]|uniref:Uncharacterized protein n=1 Tax=Pseudomonas syringae pv. coryli TaxID=317659 RepID=A0A0P9Q3I3_9PSED|nr:Unknown protein sequence [Pseudomonas syringae pv. coryli]